MQLLAKDGVYLPTAPRAIQQGLLASGNRADVLINCPAGNFTIESTGGIGSVQGKSAINGTLLHIRSVVDEYVPSHCVVGDHVSPPPPAVACSDSCTDVISDPLKNGYGLPTCKAARDSYVLPFEALCNGDMGFFHQNTICQQSCADMGFNYADPPCCTSQPPSAPPAPVTICTACDLPVFEVNWPCCEWPPRTFEPTICTPADPVFACAFGRPRRPARPEAGKGRGV